MAVALAAVGPADRLQVHAERGEAVAQLAWSLVLRHGLHGVPTDRAGADHWRRAAIAPRGQQQVVAYTPAFRGDPSRVNLIPIPARDVSLVDAALAERCAAALSAPPTSAVASDACGSPHAFARLRERWSQ